MSSSEFHEMLLKIVSSKYNGPKQLMFAIALSNTEHLRKQQREIVSKSLLASALSQQSCSKPKVSAACSPRQKLLEYLALLKFIGPQLLGFLSTSESSSSTIRLLNRMSGACENIASILRDSSQSEESNILPDSRDTFEMLWETLNIDEPSPQPVDDNSVKFQLLIRRYRADLAFIISRQISKMPMMRLWNDDDAQELSYIDKQNERCRLLSRIAGTEKSSCEACISALCTSVEEARKIIFLIIMLRWCTCTSNTSDFCGEPEFVMRLSRPSPEIHHRGPQMPLQTPDIPCE
jgi:hypothetical protein